MQTKLFPLVFLGILMAFGLPCALPAQKLSKEETKKLQAELKTLAKNPDKLKAQKKISEELTSTENMRNAQYIDMKSKIKAQENNIKALDDQITTHNIELGKLNVSLQAPQTPTKVDAPKRAIYRIQIGAYSNGTLAQALQNQQNFEVEPIENGLKRYLVGKFTSYKEADKLVVKLRNIGAQAFIVGYLDGKRLGNLKEMPSEFMQK